ncbi:YCF48-related protein [Fulvivirgaceae bacterium BMA12]|uniref:YCF48-related protein n=1 Tax=Agaribacillus aureus TaxID=3051825 RepID=A0ABT8KYG9_9BACT|nr:YCF48-related protein [Fulvivirgaceae bacterium BMA12]
MKNSTSLLVTITIILSIIVVLSACNDDDELTTPEKISVISISEDAGYPGDSVFIQGTSLDKMQSITIDGEAVKVVRSSENEIVFIIEDHTTSGNLILDFGGIATSYEKFFKIYDPAWENLLTIPNTAPVAPWSHDFVTAEKGFVSDGASLNKTIDGGNNWEAVLTGNNLSSFQAVDEHTVWVHGDSWNAKRSIDGGVSWTDIKFRDDFLVDEIYFTSAMAGWAIGRYASLESSGILATDDGGMTWTEALKVEKKLFHYTYTKIFQPSQNLVFIPDLENKILLKTSDSGENWEEIIMHFNHPVFSDDIIHFVNENIAWLSSNKGVFKSEDGGENWTEVIVDLADVGEEIVGIHFFNDKKGVLLGSKGAIVITEDGGVNWDLLYIEAGFIKADLISPGNVLIARTDHAIIRRQFN